MLNFDFHMPTRIVFGKDTDKEAGKLLAPYTKKLLIHYGGGSIKKNGLYDTVVSSLKQEKIDFVELGGAVPNPRLTLVREGIELCRKEGVDFILALGGGSAIDSSKAIAMGVCFEGDVWDIYEKNIQVPRALPVATIPTLPAAGSETSVSSVITNEEKQLKIGYDNNAIRPVLSIINPEYFFTLPKNQIANGVADMMSHILERYFTPTLQTDVTDGMCEAILKTIMRHARIVMDRPDDYDAWCQIGLSASLAHNNILGIGRRQDWACHMMEHELSAIYDVAHGAGLAVLTPAWMEYVYKQNINMFVQFAVNVMGVEGSYREPEALVKEGITRLADFFKELGLPDKLSQLGIDESRLAEMAKKATKAAFGEEKPLGGLAKLRWQDVEAIYKLAK